MSNKEENKLSRGRPTKYTEELRDIICERIAEGESVRNIVKDKTMPSSSTIFRWLLDEEKKDFWEQYNKARNIQAELMFEELIEIADDGSNDYIERETEKGNIVDVLNSEHISRSRLRVDTRKWFLSKVLPKKFGEKMDFTTDGEKIQSLTFEVIDGLKNKNDTGISEDSESEDEDSITDGE